MKRHLLMASMLGLLSITSVVAEDAFEDLLARGDLSAFHTGDKEGRWSYVDGVASRGPIKAGSLITKKKYQNFELHFEWKIEEGGNSGVIYRVNQWPGLEYQVLDDERHIRGQWDISRAAALYGLKGRSDDSCYRQAGEWNSGRIIASGSRLEHWLNGVKVIDLDMDSADWAERFAKSKYKQYSEFPEFARGASRIHFQDHGAQVWYRSILIRELE